MSGPRSDGPGRHFGVYPAIVTDIVDPQSLGRIQVRLPWLGEDDGDVRAWATLVTPYADDDQGFEFLPAVDTQVVVAFEAGDLRRPYLLGSAWNGREALPEDPETANNKRLIRTREGSLLEFDDTAGSAKVTVSMQSGHRLVMEDSPRRITLSHADGTSVTLESAKISIQANGTLDVKAGVVNVTAGMAKFSGTVQCSTLITNAVVSSSYTPGAGNVW